MDRLTDGTNRIYKLEKRTGVNIAFGTDILVDPVLWLFYLAKN